jgi:hypothetical protein
MPKRRKKNEFTQSERVAYRLDIIKNSSQLSEKEKEIISSLLRYFLINNELTVKQISLAESLIIKHKVGLAPKRQMERKYYLYAIATDRDVKLGFSVDPSKRLKDLQTSNSRILRILWKCYTGSKRSEAVNNERKLHSICKQYKINREWFEFGCMKLVRQFKPKYK